MRRNARSDRPGGGSGPGSGGPGSGGPGGGGSEGGGPGGGEGAGGRLPWSYVLRGLLRHRGSTAMTVGAVALVSVIWMGLHAMILSMQATLEQSGLPERAVVMAREATAENQSRIRPGLRIRVASSPQVRLAGDGRALISSELSATTYAQVRGERAQISVRGVEFRDALAVHPELRLLQGRLPLEGSPELMAGRGVAAALDLHPGDTLSAWRQRWQVTGVFAESGTPFESELWTSRVSTEQFASRGHVTSLWILGRDARALEELGAELEEDPRLGLQLVSETAFFGRSAMAARELTLLVYFVSGLLAVGAVLSAVNTLYASITARQGEFAALRAIGFRPGAVWGSVMRESVMMAAGGGVVGCLAALALDGAEFRTLVSGIGFVSFVLRMEAGVLLSGLAFAVSMGALGGVLPARASVARSVVEALQRSTTCWLVAGLAAVGAAAGGVGAAHAQGRAAGGDATGTGGGAVGGVDTLRLDLAGAAVRMVERHPGLRGDRAAERASRYELRERRLAYWPEIRLDMSVYALSEAQRFPRFTPEDGLELVARGEPRTFWLQVEAEQPVNGLLTAREQVRAAQAGVSEAQAESDLGRMRALLDLQSHVLRMVHVEAMTRVQEQILQEKRRQFEIALSLADDSLATREQVLEVQAEAGAEQERLALLKIRRKEHEYGVRSLADVPPEVPLEVVPPGHPAVFEPFCLAGEGWATRQWAASHPERVVIERSAEQVASRMRAERHAAAPQVALSARVVYSGPPDVFGVDLPGLSQVTARAGLVVRYPIRASRASFWRMRALDGRREALQARLSDWDRHRLEGLASVEREFDAACARWSAALARLELATERVRAAERELERGGADSLGVSKAREGRLRVLLELEELRLSATDLRLRHAELRGTPLRPSELETDPRP